MDEAQNHNHINTYTDIQARSIIWYLYTPTPTLTHTCEELSVSIEEERGKGSNLRHAKTNKYYIDTQQHIPIKVFVCILMILLSFRLISRYFL